MGRDALKLPYFYEIKTPNPEIWAQRSVYIDLTGVVSVALFHKIGHEAGGADFGLRIEGINSRSWFIRCSSQKEADQLYEEVKKELDKLSKM